MLRKGEKKKLKGIGKSQLETISQQLRAQGSYGKVFSGI